MTRIYFDFQKEFPPVGVLLYVKSLSAFGRRFSHAFSLQTRTRVRYFFRSPENWRYHCF